VSRPRLLDLFCGAGGAAFGYHQAGFEVVGVDINPQPRYPFEFHQADAMTFPLDGFDAIHASPPCQGYSTITPDKTRHPRLIGPIRERLQATGVPYVIENVEGARRYLRHPVKLCGSSFGLAVRRHRYFESNVPLMSIPCAHGRVRPIGVYGDHPENDHDYRRPDGTRRGAKALTVDHAREVMGMPWATWPEIVEAIPPAFSSFIGEQLLEHLAVTAA
jgi:DNA (cytosine-5)-methyltransferase 1